LPNKEDSKIFCKTSTVERIQVTELGHKKNKKIKKEEDILKRIQQMLKWQKNIGIGATILHDSHSKHSAFP